MKDGHKYNRITPINPYNNQKNTLTRHKPTLYGLVLIPMNPTWQPNSTIREERKHLKSSPYCCTPLTLENAQYLHEPLTPFLYFHNPLIPTYSAASWKPPFQPPQYLPEPHSQPSYILTTRSPHLQCGGLVKTQLATTTKAKQQQQLDLRHGTGEVMTHCEQQIMSVS